MLQLWNFVKTILRLFSFYRNGQNHCGNAKGVSRKKESQRGCQILLERTCSTKEKLYQSKRSI